MEGKTIARLWTPTGDERKVFVDYDGTHYRLRIDGKWMESRYLTAESALADWYQYNPAIAV